MKFSETFRGISNKELQGLIKRAMQDMDRNGYPVNRKSTTYDVVDADGEKYPPLEVIRRTAAFANRDIVGWLKWGDQVNNFYRELGFMVYDKKGKLYKYSRARSSGEDNFVRQEMELSISTRIFDDGEIKDIGPEVRDAIEGDLAEKKVMARKRNRTIADKRKKDDGYACLACGFSYNQKVVECHHLKPMAMNGKSRITLGDLVTLCPTCHRLAHSLIDGDYSKYTNKVQLIKELKNIRQDI